MTETRVSAFSESGLVTIEVRVGGVQAFVRMDLYTVYTLQEQIAKALEEVRLWYKLPLAIPNLSTSPNPKNDPGGDAKNKRKRSPKKR